MTFQKHFLFEENKKEFTKNTTFKMFLWQKLSKCIINSSILK